MKSFLLVIRSTGYLVFSIGSGSQAASEKAVVDESLQQAIGNAFGDARSLHISNPHTLNSAKIQSDC